LQPIPAGDVFLHAGDFTRSGAVSEVREFNTWLGQVSDLFANYLLIEVLLPSYFKLKNLLIIPIKNHGYGCAALNFAEHSTYFSWY
jgi:hypothetical protein